MKCDKAVIDYCLEEYQTLKAALCNQGESSEFDLDYELRFVLFLSSEIDGIQNKKESEFIVAISDHLEWSSVYQNILL